MAVQINLLIKNPFSAYINYTAEYTANVRHRPQPEISPTIKSIRLLFISGDWNGFVIKEQETLTHTDKPNWLLHDDPKLAVPHPKLNGEAPKYNILLDICSCFMLEIMTKTTNYNTYLVSIGLSGSQKGKSHDFEFWFWIWVHTHRGDSFLLLLYPQFIVMSDTS